eukprot:11213258-Lingulodinium_polyedra.AAC.1
MATVAPAKTAWATGPNLPPAPRGPRCGRGRAPNCCGRGCAEATKRLQAGAWRGGRHGPTTHGPRAGW